MWCRCSPTKTAIDPSQRSPNLRTLKKYLGFVFARSCTCSSRLLCCVANSTINSCFLLCWVQYTIGRSPSLCCQKIMRSQVATGKKKSGESRASQASPPGPTEYVGHRGGAQAVLRPIRREGLWSRQAGDVRVNPQLQAQSTKILLLFALQTPSNETQNTNQREIKTPTRSAADILRRSRQGPAEEQPSSVLACYYVARRRGATTACCILAKR